MATRPRRATAPRLHARIWSDHLRNRLWVIPMGFAAAAFLLAVGITRWDALHDVTGNLGYRGDRESASATLSTIATAMLTFLGLVFSISVVALQLASGQLSPRVMRLFQRDRRTQVILGIFLATFVFSLVAMAAIGDADAEVAAPLVGVAFLLVGASLVAFVAYLQHITESLRAAWVIEAIAAETRSTISQVYPAVGAVRPRAADPVDRRPATTVGAPRPGVVAAINLEGLARRAEQRDAFVRVLVPIGSYVAEGQPLLALHGGAWADGDARLARMVDLARSRTMVQDVSFGIRQLVDVAERALSPAINDPTTAVQALDRIGDVLRRIVVRPDPPHVLADAGGTARVSWVVPEWAAVVDLAFNEVRWFGREAVQVTRRMTSILDDLLDIAPPERAAALLEQHRLLAEAVGLALPEQLRAAALVADPMGLGGAPAGSAAAASGGGLL